MEAFALIRRNEAKIIDLPSPKLSDPYNAILRMEIFYMQEQTSVQILWEEVRREFLQESLRWLMRI